MFSAKWDLELTALPAQALVLLIIVCMLPGITRVGAAHSDGVELRSIISQMRLVCDYYLNRASCQSNSWEDGTFYIGVMATYHTTEDRKYLDAAVKWGRSHAWSVRPDPGNLSCAQAYLEAYRVARSPEMLKPTQIAADAMFGGGYSGRELWRVCDSLFMSPGVLSHLASLTEDPECFRRLHVYWWDVVDHLYDQNYHLFYRDATQFEVRSPNGLPVFWSRGNGWVIAGTVRVLQYLPDDDPTRARYEELLREMSEALIPHQGDDGLWRTNLLDTNHYRDRETSGTALFCYGLAWGMNRGILERATFLPVVLRAWKGLSASVGPTGRVKWVQRVDYKPSAVAEYHSASYGAGAFLLAATQVHALLSQGHESDARARTGHSAP